MPPAFTIGHILGPVAAATVLNVFVFALLWRWDRVEVRTGAPTWQIWVTIPLYGISLGTFAYLMQDKPFTTPLQLFGTVVGGEMMGAGIVYLLLNAFLWSREQPIRERLAPMAASIFGVAFLAAAVFS